MRLKNVLKMFGVVFCFMAGMCFSVLGVNAGTIVDVSERGLLTPTKVDDINIYNDYITNRMAVNTKGIEKPGYVYKLEVKEDSLIKIEMRSDYLTGYDKDEKTGWKKSTAAPSVYFIIYRDEAMWNQVSNKYTATGSTKAETGNAIALDKCAPGEYYYIWVGTDDPSCTSETKGSDGNVQMIVYQQEIKSDETYRPSAKEKKNTITLGKEYTGLLTATNPKDYYEFELKKRALVKFECKYNATEYAGSSYKQTWFTLFSSKDERLFQDSYAGDHVWYPKEFFLEPGKYYYTLETNTSYMNGAMDYNDGGMTQFKITTTAYNLDLKQKGTTVNSYIKVSTIDNVKEIRMVRGKLTNSQLRDAKWNAASIITDEKRFGVNKAGWYTVRVTDEYDNMFMKAVRVKKCDKKAPAAPTVSSYKSGSTRVIGKAEKGSTVTVYYGGTTPYTCKAAKNGVYSCKIDSGLTTGVKLDVTATDLAGNVSKTTTVYVK